MSLLSIAAAAVLQAAAVPAPQQVTDAQPATPAPPAAEAGAPPVSPAAPPEEIRRGPVNVAAEIATDANITPYAPEFFAGYRPNTALDMVNRLPGFSLDDGDSVRGFAGAAGNVILDGARPASKNETLTDLLNRIPAGQVARIDVIRGGAPGVDMQGRSVIANVIRKSADSLQQVLILREEVFTEDGRDLTSARYELTRRAGPRTLDLSVGRSIGYDDSTGIGRRTRRDRSGAIISDETVGNESDGFGPNGRGSFKTPLFGGELRLNGSAGENFFKSEAHFDGTNGRLDIVDKSSDVDGEIGGNYTRAIGPAWSTELVALQKLGASLFVSNFTGPDQRDIFTSDVKTGESIGRGVLKYRRSDRLSFEGGGEAAFNFREGAIAFTSNGEPIELPSADVRVEEKRAEGFILANWRPSPKLTVEAGSRFEQSTISQLGDNARERSFTYVKPRVLTTWSPREGSQLRLRFERELGQLDFGDFITSANLVTGVLSGGNAELEPDKTWAYELTGEQRFWETGAIVVTLRHEEITDAIDRVPVFETDPATGAVLSVLDAAGNIGDGTNDEIEFNLTLPLKRFGNPGGEIKIESEFRVSEVTDPTTGETRRISGQRPDEIEVAFRQDIPSRNLTLNATWFDGWREAYYAFNEVSHFVLPRYVAAGVEWKPRPNTVVTFQVENITRFRFKREREQFEGPRNTDPLAFSELRENRSQVRAFVRLRRTFGA